MTAGEPAPFGERLRRLREAAGLTADGIGALERGQRPCPPRGDGARGDARGAARA